MKQSPGASVEETVSFLLSDEKYMETCLSLLVQCILRADSYGRNKWGLFYSKKEGIRLLVGNLIVFTIHKDEIWLSLDKQRFNERKDYQRLLDENTAWRWDSGKWSEYKAIPSCNGYYSPSNLDLNLWQEVLQDLHFAYLEKATQKYQQLNYRSQLRHTSKLLIFLEKVFGQPIPCPNYNNPLEDDLLEDIKEFKEKNRGLSETERERIIQSRVGQGIFRSYLEDYWRNACSVTGCKSSALLIASHIKPWKDSNNLERLDVYNWLLLVPNVD